MNWYKKHIYASWPPMSLRNLIYKLKLLGIVELIEAEDVTGNKKASGHMRFINTHTGYYSDVPAHDKDVSGGTIKNHIVNRFGLGDVWKKLPARPTNKQIAKIQHLLPWNKEKSEEEKLKQKNIEKEERKKQETIDSAPWNIKYKEVYKEEERKRQEAKRKDEEETMLLEEMIRQDELNKIKPALAEGKMNWYKKANRWKDHIPGGRADGRKPSDYEISQVEKGKRIEYEHTDNSDTAKEISMDHLEEHPDYYHEEKGLPAMEDNLGDKGKLEKKKPVRRGRYPGQDENQPRDMMPDIIRDNEVVEGPHVKILHNMAVNKNWDGFNAYIQKLKDEGHKKTRIDSMMTRAMYKVKL